MLPLFPTICPVGLFAIFASATKVNLATEMRALEVAVAIFTRSDQNGVNN